MRQKPRRSHFCRHVNVPGKQSLPFLRLAQDGVVKEVRSYSGSCAFVRSKDSPGDPARHFADDRTVIYMAMSFFLAAIVTLACLGCLLDLSYRIAFEGVSARKRPVSYLEARVRLHLVSRVGRLVVFVGLVYMLTWWAAVLWLLSYGAAETLVERARERRALRQLARKMARVDPLQRIVGYL